MLTQSEKKWLKARRLRQAKHHIYHRNEYFIWSGYHFAKDEIADLKDALEFSERVAVKLASWEQNLSIPCMETAVCERHPQDCAWCRLKYARLQVEEEMDGYHSWQNSTTSCQNLSNLGFGVRNDEQS